MRLSWLAALLATIAAIIARDWQTSGARADARDLLAKTSVEARDLDADGRAEFLLRLDYAPGATGNISFYALDPTDWRVIGEFGGSSYGVRANRRGFADIETIWRYALDRYETIVYAFRDGRYEEVRREPWSPSSD